MRILLEKFLQNLRPYESLFPISTRILKTNTYLANKSVTILLQLHIQPAAHLIAFVNVIPQCMLKPAIYNSSNAVGGRTGQWCTTTQCLQML